MSRQNKENTDISFYLIFSKKKNDTDYFMKLKAF